MKTLKLIITFIILSHFSFAQQEQIGIITTVKGKQLIVKLETAPTNVKVDNVGFVSKDLTGLKGPFGTTFTGGWLDIGEVKVKSIIKNMANLEIIKEKTDIVVNGKVQKQFVVGTKIKLQWSK